MKFSLITPTHNGNHLKRLEQSILNQKFKDFEWVILCNNGFSIDRAFFTGELDIKIHHFGSSPKIGEIKKAAFALGRGDFLVEVDHDDELLPHCLSTLAEHEADFIYSDCLRIRNEVQGTPVQDWQQSGWEFGICRHNDKTIVYPRSFPPRPDTFSKIWFAPDHVRVWRRSFYDEIGVHDHTLEVCDDHDLLCRTYIATSNIRQIKQPLYVYHIHDNNTCYGERNAKIQELTLQIHDKYIYQMALKWSQRNGLRAIDLCGGHDCPEGFESWDLTIGIDLNSDWPACEEVGVFRAHDALEHLKNPIHTMNNAYRCLVPNGWFLTKTPSTDGRGAFQDPTHVSFWNSNSFWYYTDPKIAKYINCDAKFQANRVFNYFPSDWHQFHNISYVKADLLKVTVGSAGPNPWRQNGNIQ